MWHELTDILFPGEIIGYIGRIVGAKQDVGCWTMGPFVIQSLLILIAPALMAASIYMILGRIILLTDGENLALIKRRWLTKLFVTGDVISLFSQAAGKSEMKTISLLVLTGSRWRPHGCRWPAQAWRERDNCWPVCAVSILWPFHRRRCPLSSPTFTSPHRESFKPDGSLASLPHYPIRDGLLDLGAKSLQGHRVHPRQQWNHYEKRGLRFYF